jgi:integrase
MSLPKGVTKRGDKYRVNASGNGKRVTATVNTPQEALETRTIMRAELCIPRGTKTLQDAFEQTVRERWGRLKGSHETVRTTKLAIAYFGKGLPLDELSRTDLTAYEEHCREQGNADATINRKLAGISTMLRVAYEHGWIEKVPVIHRTKERNGRIRWLSNDEERVMLSLLTQWGKADVADCVNVLLDTAMRTGEVWALEKRDIDFSTNLIHIFDNKTDLPRSLPMTKRVRNILFARTVTRNRPFPFDNGWLEYVWNRARSVMDLMNDKQFVPYVCRHTCATRLLQRGMSLPELQKWLGHTNITMTMRYAHLCPTALLKGAALLEQGRCDHEVDTIDWVAVDDKLRNGPVLGVRGAFSPLTPDECPTVPGVHSNPPTEHVQSTGEGVGDGGSNESTGATERGDAPEPKSPNV